MSYQLTNLTPNLVVADVQRSIAFYRDVLGFSLEQTVPEAAPYVFAIMKHGPVEIFLNARDAAEAEYPAFAARPIGGTLTLFVHVTGIHQAYDALKARVPIVMPLERKWYGVTEFAFTDPDRWIVTFAEAGA